MSTSRKGDIKTIIDTIGDKQIPFSEIADGINNYKSDDGYNNLDKWVESSAIKHNH